ncbi:MAG: HlyD family secretion protein [Pseudomonadota bacterium]
MANADPAEQAETGSGAASLRRATLIALALGAIVFLYLIIADRTTPFAGDARVQAFVLRVAPEVTGQVRRVDVADNQVVEAGAVLFEIDPTPFRIAVDQAQAQLEQAGQNIGASTASVDSAQARLDEARAAEANVIAQSSRILELVDRGVYSEARRDQAEAEIETARAATERAEADLAQAREALGPEGADNPQVQTAVAALERARFDLSRTRVSAPARGVVTNLQLAGGQTVVAGQPAMTFLSAEDVWLIASLRENSVGVVEAGQSAEVVLDALPGRVFQARVVSIGWGVGGGSVDPATGLPNSTSEEGWLSAVERFPVQLAFEDEIAPDDVRRGRVRYGSRAAVIVYSGDNALMNALAWLRIRLISWLTYVS